MTHKSGKTIEDRLRYKLDGLVPGKVLSGYTRFDDEMTSADLGPTVVQDFGHSDLRARLEAVRDDRRLKRTPENMATKVALIAEATASGWSRSDIARILWTTPTNITQCLRMSHAPLSAGGSPTTG